MKFLYFSSILFIGLSSWAQRTMSGTSFEKDQRHYLSSSSCGWDGEIKYSTQKMTMSAMNYTACTGDIICDSKYRFKLKCTYSSTERDDATYRICQSDKFKPTRLCAIVDEEKTSDNSKPQPMELKPQPRKAHSIN